MHFQFDMALEAFEKSGASGRERRIAGIVSTDHLDRQDEVLIQEGLDFGPFLKSGFFNDNHAADTTKVVGYPELAELRPLEKGKRGWYVEGYLLKGEPGEEVHADEIWNLAKALQKTDRRLGFSVEGTIVERDPVNPKIVRKAIVREIAITKCPVNTNTSLIVLAKSLSVGTGPAAKNTPISGEGAGAVLAPQSLEASPKRKKKNLKKSEAIDFLRRMNAQLTHEAAEKIVDHALRWHPATDE